MLTPNKSVLSQLVCEVTNGLAPSLRVTFAATNTAQWPTRAFSVAGLLRTEDGHGQGSQ